MLFVKEDYRKTTGSVRIDDKCFLFQDQCPNCEEVYHGKAPIEVLNVDPLCIHCNSMVAGHPIYRVKK